MLWSLITYVEQTPLPPITLPKRVCPPCVKKSFHKKKFLHTYAKDTVSVLKNLKKNLTWDYCVTLLGCNILNSFSISTFSKNKTLKLDLVMQFSLVAITLVWVLYFRTTFVTGQGRRLWGSAGDGGGQRKPSPVTTPHTPLPSTGTKNFLFFSKWNWSRIKGGSRQKSNN